MEFIDDFISIYSWIHRASFVDTDLYRQINAVDQSRIIHALFDVSIHSNIGFIDGNQFTIRRGIDYMMDQVLDRYASNVRIDEFTMLSRLLRHEWNLMDARFLIHALLMC